MRDTPIWSDLIAPLSHRPRAALNALRTRGRFEDVERFCLFIGYPRSGHTLLGSLINAHRETLISHELNALRFVNARFTRAELYALILERDRWFAGLDRHWTGYDYTVPGQWHGRWERLRVIGDKRGGGSAALLSRHPDLLDRLQRTVGVPILAIHHVRDPFDNIATISRRDERPLADAIAMYFGLAEAATAALDRLPPDAQLLVYHEDLVADPGATLDRVAAALGLTPDPAWREACAARIFPSARRTRDTVPWTPDLEATVRSHMAAFPHLARYGA
jgi:hypothetical protein